MKRTRPITAPYGVPTSVLFYGHNPGEPYAAASKIKTIDVHPVLPWAVTADEVSASARVVKTIITGRQPLRGPCAIAMEDA